MLPAQGFKKTDKHNISKRLYHWSQVTRTFQVTSSLKGNRQRARSGTVPGGTGALLLWKPQTSHELSTLNTFADQVSDPESCSAVCSPASQTIARLCYPMDGVDLIFLLSTFFLPGHTSISEARREPIESLRCHIHSFLLFSTALKKNLGPLLPQGLPYLASSVIDPACHILCLDTFSFVSNS